VSETKPALAQGDCSARETTTPYCDLLERTTLNPADWMDLARRMERERNEWKSLHWNAHHHAHQMFLETLQLREALMRVRAWGITGKGFDASDASAMAKWVDAGCVGPLPDPNGPWIYAALPNPGLTNAETLNFRSLRWKSG